ncbi:MAG: helix-turn-helix transcriptional regulator [Roseivirga sp.]|nr:helix-turn-helix transcriptional regulator [Roseivirga sp.]
MKDVWFILHSIGLAQGVFLIIALLLLKGKSRYSVGLLLLILLFPLTLLLYEWLVLLLPDENVHQYFRRSEILPFLIGPLFLLYTFSVLKPEEGFKRKYLLHFIPFLIFLAFPFHRLSASDKLDFVNQASAYGLPLKIAIFTWFKGLYSVLYLAVSVFYTYKFKVGKLSSAKKKLRANLIFWMMIFQIIGTLTVFTFFTLQFLNSGWEIRTNSIGALFFAFSYFVFALILIRSSSDLIPDDEKALAQNRYNLSLLNGKEKEKILSRLYRVLEEEKPYLLPDLKIGELASRLEISSNTLSQVINELLHMNFNQLINKYRIEAVKRNIHDERKTLYGIALDHGFKSKSAFNRVFKDMTGHTPSSYKKSLQR